MNSNFNKIGPTAAELSALERLKYHHRRIIGKMVSPFKLT